MVRLWSCPRPAAVSLGLMPTRRRLPRLIPILGSVALLVGLTGGLGGFDGAERLGSRSAATITATGFIGSATGAPETRVQRDVGAGERQPGWRLEGVAKPPTSARASRAWAAALAAMRERAEHPERVGHILVRGPPAASA